MVTVRFFSKTRLLTKESSLNIEATRVDELLRKISEHYARVELTELRNSVIFVNGKSIAELKLYKTKLRDGDEVALFSPVSGG